MKILNFWLPVLLWAAVIFTFSNMKTHQASNIYWQEFIVKKTAHLVEYSIFYILIYRAILNTTNFNKKKTAAFALIILVLYAISDEVHQSFTPGREPTIRDVLIDSTAGLLAWTAIWKLLPIAPRKLKDLARNLQIA
jgi:hypothetical protein